MGKGHENYDHMNSREKYERDFKSQILDLYKDKKHYFLGGLVTLSGFGLSYMLEGTINPIELMSLAEEHQKNFALYMASVVSKNYKPFEQLKYEGLKFIGDLTSILMISGGPTTSFIIKKQGKE